MLVNCVPYFLHHKWCYNLYYVSMFLCFDVISSFQWIKRKYFLPQIVCRSVCGWVLQFRESSSRKIPLTGRGQIPLPYVTPSPLIITWWIGLWHNHMSGWVDFLFGYDWYFIVSLFKFPPEKKKKKFINRNKNRRIRTKNVLMWEPYWWVVKYRHALQYNRY